MIIVSQDRTNVINFDNIINIKYADFTNISGGHEIYCHETKTEAITLGIYKTERSLISSDYANRFIREFII